jgi:hypothetical protein
VTVRHSAFRAALIVASVLALAACDDEGGYLVAENQSDQELLVRAVGTTYDSDIGSSPGQVVVVLPPKAKVVVAEIPFAGGFKVQRVDVLNNACEQVGSVATYGPEGLLVVVHDDMRVELRKEFPRSGTAEAPTDRCPPPEPLPSSSPLSASPAS